VRSPRHFLLAVLALQLAAATPQNTASSVELLPTPVVTATIHQVDATAFEASIRVQGSSTELSTVLLGIEGGMPGAVATLRRTTVVREGMLFVRTECGGGTSWRCHTEHVFP
jgi:hypothetical protein